MNGFERRLAMLEGKAGGTDINVLEDPELLKTTETIFDAIKDYPEIIERIKSRISAIVPRKNLNINDIRNHPDFWDYRSIIIQELNPYRELRERVSNRLLEIRDEV